MRNSTRYNLVAVVMIFCAAFAEAEPMTQEQAEAWVREQIALGANGVSTIARKISALDFILQAVPVVTLPQRVLVVDGEDLVMSWQPGYVELTVAKPNTAPYLVYRISQPAERVKGLVPHDSPWPVICGILAGALISTAAMDAVPPIAGAPLAREGIAWGSGGLAGLAVWWLWPR
jgi:hypothetical protein